MDLIPTLPGLALTCAACLLACPIVDSIGLWRGWWDE